MLDILLIAASVVVLCLLFYLIVEGAQPVNYNEPELPTTDWVADKYHPEFGTEWQPGGSYHYLLEQTRQEALEAAARKIETVHADHIDYVMDLRDRGYPASPSKMGAEQAAAIVRSLKKEEK
jgi:hypothetical protein